MREPTDEESNSSDQNVTRRTYLKAAGLSGAAFSLSGVMSTQTAYEGSTHALPGRIQAERFDEGGEGTAYHDTTSKNKGGAFRTDEAVDVQAVDDSSGTYNVGWIRDGEWLEYTTDVAAGTYDLALRVATNTGGGTLTVSMDGSTLGSVDVSDTGGWQSWTTVTIPDVTVDGGTGRVLRLDFSGGSGFLFNVNWIEFVASGDQQPYDGTMRSIPGRIQTERFDEGGEGVAYHDTSSKNKNGDFRSGESVDVSATSDSSGKYHVGWVQSGEWLEYTSDVTAGTYDVNVRAATDTSGGTLTFSLDGTKLGSVDVTDTGGWNDWTTVTLPDVTVDGGAGQVLRVDFSGSADFLFDVNWIEFTESASSDGQKPYNGTMRSIPGRIQTERFDEGGEGVAYHDTSSKNKNGDFRSGESVDVSATSDSSGKYHVGYVKDGEWLEYTSDVTAGTYDVNVRAATDTSGGTVTLSLDGTTLGSVDVSDTGGWKNWTTVTLPDVTVDGGSGQVLRADFSGSSDFLFDVNWIEFVESSGGDGGDTAAPTAPSNLDVTGASTSAVDLDWDASSDSGTGVDHYNVYQDGSVADRTVAGTTKTTVKDLSSDTTYEFWVTAVDGAGNESDPSNSVTPTTESSSSSSAVTVEGERKTWHKVTLSLDGPSTSEGAKTNPFFDQRFSVTFTKPSGSTVTVPGFFAADGDAADTGANSGSTWQAHLLPDETGTWTYETTFEEGPGVAPNPGSGSRNGTYSGLTGTFDVSSTDKSGRDFRAHGLLEYVGEQHWRFAGSGEWFLKNGADSPENFLGYADFDNTPNARHTFGPHEGDYNSGDPTWDGGKGKGIVGAVNYLASEGVNSQYFLPYTVDGGDGGDTYPWTGESKKRRYDVSKLAQWEIVFEHMTRNGVGLHVQTQETENDAGLDGGDLGPERKVYYRELIARFGHHPMVLWNLGEETNRTTTQLENYAAYIRDLDPYDHPIGVHTYPNEQDDVWGPLVGNPNIDYGPVQNPQNYDPETLLENWVDETESSGQPWVIGADEIGDWRVGVPCDGETVDGVDQTTVRKGALWPSLLSQTGGCEWYFGMDSCAHDTNAEDYRTRDNWWDWTRYATQFFVENVPFWEMEHDDGILSNASGDAMSHPNGTHYVVYLDSGGDATVDLDSGTYTLQWYNPRNGTFESSETVSGGSGTSLGSPPISGDAVALLTQ